MTNDQNCSRTVNFHQFPWTLYQIRCLLAFSQSYSFKIDNCKEFRAPCNVMSKFEKFLLAGQLDLNFLVLFQDLFSHLDQLDWHFLRTSGNNEAQELRQFVKFSKLVDEFLGLIERYSEVMGFDELDATYFSVLCFENKFILMEKEDSLFRCVNSKRF